MAPSKCEIEHILSDMRTAIENGKFLAINRKKNLLSLAKLGFTWKDVRPEIYNLEVEHYYSGPEKDRDYPFSDQLWVFKKSIEGNLVYIKFKILYQEDQSVKVISFHIDEG